MKKDYHLLKKKFIIPVFLLLLIPFVLLCDSQNLISNGQFDRMLSHWNFFCHKDASASARIINKECKVSIRNGGKENWHVHLRQNKLPVIKGHTYLLRFEARSQQPRKIQVTVEKNGAPWTSYSNRIDLSLTNSMKSYSYSFTMKYETDQAASLCFELGLNNTGVVIDNVELTNKTEKKGNLQTDHK